MKKTGRKQLQNPDQKRITDLGTVAGKGIEICPGSPKLPGQD